MGAIYTRMEHGPQHSPSASILIIKMKLHCECVYPSLLLNPYPPEAYCLCHRYSNIMLLFIAVLQVG